MKITQKLFSLTNCTSFYYNRNVSWNVFDMTDNRKKVTNCFSCLIWMPEMIRLLNHFTSENGICELQHGFFYIFQMKAKKFCSAITISTSLFCWCCCRFSAHLKKTDCQYMDNKNEQMQNWKKNKEKSEWNKTKKKTIIKLTHSSSYGIIVWYRERNDNVYYSLIALVESNAEEITMEKRKDDKKNQQKQQKYSNLYTNQLTKQQQQNIDKNERKTREEKQKLPFRKFCRG